MDSSTGLNNVDNESPFEVQKIIEVWTDYTQYFRSSPKVDLNKSMIHMSRLSVAFHIDHS
jgi:hypothetical protein